MAAKNASARPARAPRSQSRGADRDVRGVLFRLNYEGLKALRQLAVDEDRTLQSIGIEALNDVLRKYGRRPVAESVLSSC